MKGEKTKKCFFMLAGFIVSVFIITSLCYAIPQMINYQGYLTDSEGYPLDGTVDMVFSLYDVDTGGTALWAEAQTVTVTKGIYTVILGQPGNELDPTDFDGDLYLGVTVGTDLEMTPRQPITSVGYALRAAVADTVAEGAVTEIMIVDGAVTTAKVADQAITESKLGDATVTTVKIQDGATLSEISDDDGAGSGLDADLFDGQDSSAFMPAGADNWVDETGDTMTGQLQIQVASGEGLSSTTSSSSGRGVYGLASATSGYTYGVYGQSDSTEGSGVYGRAPFRGVYGLANATSGFTFGVRGESNSTSGSGVYGYATATSGTSYGVYGISNSTSGRGVYGYAAATSGETYGVRGESDSTDGRGVYGRALKYGVYGAANDKSGTNYGVYGRSESDSGYGVYGLANATSGFTFGVRGESNITDGHGVIGYAAATSGSTFGVLGWNNSTSGRGISGIVTPYSGTNYAVLGQSNSPSGWDFYAAGQGNYGPFTGTHEVKLSGDFPEKVEPGLIIAATGTTQRRQNADGSINLSSTLPTVQLSDIANDKAVFGVLVAEVSLPEDHWYEAGEGERFATVNALGEGRVWVTDTNGALEAGDYITTSVIPGYGQRQDDDLLHSYTLGKAIETVDWDQVTEIVEIDGTTYKVYLIAVIYTSG